MKLPDDLAVGLKLRTKKMLTVGRTIVPASTDLSVAGVDGKMVFATYRNHGDDRELALPLSVMNDENFLVLP